MPRSNPKKKAAPAAAWARLLALLPDDELLLAGAAAVLSAARAPCVQGVGRARARQRRQPERSILRRKLARCWRPMLFGDVVWLWGWRDNILHN